MNTQTNLQANPHAHQANSEQGSSGQNYAPVFLPATTYQTKPDPKATEEKMVDRWLESDLHNKVKDASRGRELYVLHDGPPYANGNMHLGHAVNKTLKDMTVRSMRMLGKDAVLVPGWDCHGLPVEWKVEEAYRAGGRDKRDVPVLEFRAACRDYAEGWVDKQMAGFLRLGLLMDVDNPYLTMSREADAAAVTEMHRLLLSGRLYQALRPVLWSVPEQTALADAEVEYQSERYTSLMVRFPLLSSVAPSLKSELAAGQRVSLVVWTTTPWTLPGNKAVACAPAAEYGVYRLAEVDPARTLQVGEVMVVATDLAENMLRKSGALTWECLDVMAGTALAGTSCAHPLAALGYPDQVPVLPADFVTTDAGTGLVHVAPGLGPDDHRLGLQHGLAVEPTVGADGAYVATVAHFTGEVVMGKDGKRGPADDLVLAALKSLDMVVSSWKATHETTHSWRSKAPLVYRATSQWFLAMELPGAGPEGDLRQMARKVLEDVAFNPPESKNRLLGMLEGRPDWCLSRQRSWGVPMGFFVHKETSLPLKDAKVLSRVQELFLAEGSDCWFARPNADFLGDAYDPDLYEKQMDVQDVWLESGATHAWVVEGRHGKDVVADLYLEGSDQHRGWFQSSLLESLATRGRAPFKQLRTHGFLLVNGTKMAKSTGNGVDPMDLVDKWGADTLRLWVAASNTAEDLRYSEETMKLAAEMLRRYRNTLRFLLGNLPDAPVLQLGYPDLEEPERWVLARVWQLDQQLRAVAGAHDFGRMNELLQAFCQRDLSATWFVLRKDSLYCDKKDSLRRQGVVTTLELVFDNLVRWLSVLTPFAAEEAWHTRHPERAQAWDGTESVHLGSWLEPANQWRSPELLERWEVAGDLKNQVMQVLEPARQAGAFKDLLATDLSLQASAKTVQMLAGFDLAAFCGVASCQLCAHDADIQTPVMVEYRATTGQKCVRCRSYTAAPVAGGSGDQTPDLPVLCERCEDA